MRRTKLRQPKLKCSGSFILYTDVEEGGKKRREVGCERRLEGVGRMRVLMGGGEERERGRV